MIIIIEDGIFKPFADIIVQLVNSGGNIAVPESNWTHY